MDLSEFFGNAQKSVSEGLNTLKEQALPALQSAAEKWAIEQLQKQNKETQAKVDENIAKLANSPPAPAGSFMAAFQQTIGGAAAKEFAPKILLAVGAIIAVTYLVARKGK